MQFEITLKGYDGNTDAADHLIKWVIANDRKVLDQWIEQNNLSPYIEEVREMKNMPLLTFEEGIDAIIRIAGQEIITSWKDKTAKDWINQVNSTL